MILSPRNGTTIGELTLDGSRAHLLAASASYIWVMRQDPETELWTRIEGYAITSKR
jgi:hypothetical protein